MRILRLGICTAATAVVLCLVAVSPLFIFTSPFRRFMGKDPMYHAEIARACDSVMRQHPLGTNAAIVSVAGGDESILLLDVPLSDPSLPKVIRDLRPSKITISKNRIHMIVGPRDFGLSWELQVSSTNSWALTVHSEGPRGIVYSEIKR